jgi:hypothetical protein
MTITYDKIASTTLTSTQSTITFSSITSIYTDLVAVLTIKASSAGDVYLRLNNDTGTNYSYTFLSGTGSGATSGRAQDGDYGLLLDSYGIADNNNNHIAIVNLNNYSNTTTFKTGLTRANNAAVGLDGIAATWRSTAAINALTFRFNGAQTFSAGSVITLYGIKAE